MQQNNEKENDLNIEKTLLHLKRIFHQIEYFSSFGLNKFYSFCGKMKKYKIVHFWQDFISKLCICVNIFVWKMIYIYAIFQKNKYKYLKKGAGQVLAF